MDMTDSIAPRSDQMNAEDLLAGARTFTITEVRQGSSNDQPVSVFMAEFPKERPFKPSKTVRRLMVVAWGPHSSAYVGKRMTLYRDPDVKFGGQDIGGIRVSHMSGITERLSVALATTRAKRAQYVVEPLPDEQPAAKSNRVAPPPDLKTRVANCLATFAAAGVTAVQVESWAGQPAARWSAETLDRAGALYRQLQKGEARAVDVWPAEPPPAADPQPSRQEPSDDELAPTDDELARFGGGQDA